MATPRATGPGIKGQALTPKAAPATPPSNRVSQAPDRPGRQPPAPATGAQPARPAARQPPGQVVVARRPSTAPAKANRAVALVTRPDPTAKGGTGAKVTVTPAGVELCRELAAGGHPLYGIRAVLGLSRDAFDAARKRQPPAPASELAHQPTIVGERQVCGCHFLAMVRVQSLALHTLTLIGHHHDCTRLAGVT